MTDRFPTFCRSRRGGRAEHPREDHLVPLQVTAEGGDARVGYHRADFFGRITLSGYRFG